MDDDDLIRAKAHELWEAEGRPEGRSERHWAEAREIVALRAGAQDEALVPVEQTIGEPVEPVSVLENEGDMPGLTDLGDEGGAPSRAKAAAIADEITPGEAGASARRR
jgi:hypothetical protein